MMTRRGAVLLVLCVCAAPAAHGKRPREAAERAARDAAAARAARDATSARPAAETAPAAEAVRPPAEKARRPGPGGAREVVQRESHIEFDERLVQGQAASGAIYLFQRGESDFQSMVKLPASFRDRTVRQILPAPPSGR